MTWPMFNDLHFFKGNIHYSGLPMPAIKMIGTIYQNYEPPNK